MRRDLKSNLGVDQLIDPAVVTADVDGASVDLLNFDSAMIAVAVGESADTLSGSVFISLELEESDDDVTFTDVADADMDGATGAGSGQFALIDDAAEDDAVYKVGYKGSKRYVRPVINVTGTHTNGTPIGALAMKGHPHRAPVA